MGEMQNVTRTSERVDVVLCKDCKHYVVRHLTKAMEPDKRYKPDVCIKERYIKPRRPDWYCADGERREEA